jgi:hypothetical protein
MQLSRGSPARWKPRVVVDERPVRPAGVSSSRRHAAEFGKPWKLVHAHERPPVAGAAATTTDTCRASYTRTHASTATASRQ